VASRVSLVEVISAGVQLRSSEATALVVELCRQHATGSIRGIPSAHVVRLTIDGEVAVEGPIDTKDSPVRRAAELLETLLPGFDAAPEYHVPGALRLAIARALGSLDLPPYPSLNEFCVAIFRFAEADSRQVARNLYESWRTAAAMTVSDVRRARRATRMPLQRVAARSGVPLVRLRELEWGYLRNWSVGDGSREWLVRYAHVVGLDEQVVMDAVWPLIESAACGPAMEILPPAPHAMALTHVSAPPLRRRRFYPWVVAAAAALAIALAPALWPHFHSRPVPASGEVATLPEAAVPAAVPADVETPAHRAPAIVPAAYIPSAANLGSAAFVRENGSEAVLRITKVNDEGAADFDARPSPDGAHVAFDSNRDGTRAVFVADADGGNVRRISGDGFAAMASWSPGGDQLAYVKAEAANPDVWNLWLADLATATEQRLTNYTSGQSWGGSWFPDGRHIAFGRDNTIVVLDVVTRKRRVLDVVPHERRVRMLAVSPNGRRIVFSAENDGAWLLDVGAGTARRILDDPTAGNFAWGPDGSRVAFQSARTGGWNVCILGQ
jgi:hypothetical protein